MTPTRCRAARSRRVAVEEPRRAARRATEPGEKADGGRLTGTIRAEHGEQLAGTDAQVDIRDRFDAAEALGGMAELGKNRSATVRVGL